MIYKADLISDAANHAVTGRKSRSASDYAVCFFFLSLRAFLDTMRRHRGREIEREERVPGLRGWFLTLGAKKNKKNKVQG